MTAKDNVASGGARPRGGGGGRGPGRGTAGREGASGGVRTGSRSADMEPAARGNDLPPDDDDDDDGNSPARTADSEQRSAADGPGRRRGRRGGRGRGRADGGGETASAPGPARASDGRGPRPQGRAEGRPDGRTDGRAEGRSEGRSDGRGDAAPAARSDERSEPRSDGRSRGRDDDRGRGPRMGHSSMAPGDRVRGVPNDEVVRVPDAPADAPDRPAGEYVDEVDRAGSTLRDVLNLIGLPRTEITARAPETAGDGAGLVAQVFEISGEDDQTSDELGLLIGRRGETLSSLQYLVNTIVSHSPGSPGGEDAPIFGLDIEGYRRRREQTLIDLAREVAQEVRETGDVITLEPMPAAERRIVHLTLESEPGVRTESVGSGENRQVEVMPADE